MSEQPIPEEGTCPFSTDILVDMILNLAELLSGVKFYAYQAVFARRVIESVLLQDGASITALWARQCGKSETVSNIAVALAIILPVLAASYPRDARLSSFIRGFRVGIYAPIDKQAKIPFKRMRDVVNSAEAEEIMQDPDIGVHVTSNRGDTITFSNGSIIISRTASPESQIEGETHNLVICEESQRLTRQKVEKEIRPMLASTCGTMVNIGTASNSRGGFHNTIQYNIVRAKQGHKRDHFEFNYLVVVQEKQRAYRIDGNAFHLAYGKYIESEIAKYGIDSDEFQMNYMCAWMESRVIAVRMELFKDIGMKDVEATLRPSRNLIQVAGLDVARVSDSSVLTIGEIDNTQPIFDRNAMYGSDPERNTYYNKTILGWVEMQGTFEGDEGQYKRVIEALQKTSVRVLVVDATAIGHPVFERLQAMLEGVIKVIPFVYGLQTKSALYKHYLTEIHARRLRYPAGPMTRETSSFKKFMKQHEELDKVEKGNYTVCQAPEGEHDDYPDSGALMVWAEKHIQDADMPFVEELDFSLNNASILTSSFYGGSSNRSDRYRRA